MNTLHGIRNVTALLAGALLTTASHAEVSRARDTGAIADLGQITVLAARIASADLGHLTVRAARLPQASFADIGALTVNAPRIAGARVADLGGMTVTARRITTVTVASARSSLAFWK